MAELSENDRLTIESIARSCASIQTRIVMYKIDEELFRESDYRQMAVSPLAQISKDARELSSEFMASHGDLPLDDVVQVGDQVANDLDSLDVAQAWNLVNDKIEPLRRACVKLLSDR